MKSKELSVDLIDQGKDKKPFRKLKALYVPKSTVASIIVKWKKFGTIPRVGNGRSLELFLELDVWPNRITRQE